MMTCEEFLLKVPDLVEGSLDLPQARSLETHVASCTDCAAVIAEFEAIRVELRPAVEESIDPAVLSEARTSVLRELSMAPTVGFFGGWRLRIAMGLASVASFAVAWNVFQHAEPVPPPTIAIVRPVPPVALPPEPAVASPPARLEPAPQPQAPPHTEIEVFALNIPPESEPDAKDSVILKLPSTNPDVVLYWVSETHGGS